MTKFLAAMVLGSLAVAGCVGMDEQTSDQGSEVKTSPQLNLSHIACNDDGTVTAHFVLLFAGSGNPGTLSVTYVGGSQSGIQPDKHTGNVWHYNVILPGGYVNIVSANVGTTTLHNPGEYGGDYVCDGSGDTCTFDATPGLYCTDKPLGNEGDECAEFGLVPKGKDDGLTGLTWTATMSADLVIVKSGTHGCADGDSAYNLYVNVSAGQVVSTPADQNISHVTYCECATAQ